MAAIEAGRDLQSQMVERAANLWGVDAREVRYDKGQILGPSGQVFTFRELAAVVFKTGGTIMGRGTVGDVNQSGAFGTHCVDVEVDPETGKVEILRYTIAQDVGKAIHPAMVEGQLQGGAVQGIGWALHEEYWYDEQGVMHNPTFLDYRIPTCSDVPFLDTILVEVPDPAHPYGVRGVGEAPIVPPPAALANAICRATGVRMAELPMSPPRLWQALWTRATDQK
jgi:CO/xanthine dehydrogenase Mo-binding subunit